MNLLSRILRFILLTVCVCGYAQTPTFEALQREVKTAKSDTAKFRLYLALNAEAKSNDQKIAYADSALTGATACNDSSGIARASYRIAAGHWAIGNINRTLEYAVQAGKYLPGAKRGSSDEADILFLTANAYNRLSRYEQAVACYGKAEEIVNRMDDKRLLPRILNNRGVAYMNNGDLDKALTAYLEALRLLEQNRDTAACFSAYRNVALIYHDLGRSDNQLEYLSKALRLAEQSKDIAMRSTVYAELGRFYVDRNDREQARKYFEKLLEMPQQTDDKFYLANIYDKLADYYKAIDDKEHAFQYRRKALAVMKETGIPKSIAVMHNALSQLYQAENLSDSSIYHANLAYIIAEESGNTKTQAIASLRLSQYHRQNKDIRKAAAYAETAYKKALEVEYLQLASDAAKQLGDLYEIDGRYKESNAYIRDYHILADSLRRKENVRKIAQLSSQMEYEKRESELKAQISDQEHKLRNRNRTGILLFCVLALTAALAYTSRKSALNGKRTNRILHDQKEELAAYNEELSATNEELSAVNDELHRTYEELERHREHLEETVREKTIDLQCALQQAQESDRFKAAFFANMSHEIRTPLNAILGFLQFIDDPSIEPDKRQEMIRIINSNAGQLLQMVDDIVTLSKIDSGLLIAQPGVFRVNELLAEVSAAAEKIVRHADKNKVETVCENLLPETVQTVFVDGKRIMQVLMHLIDNAVKFTDRGYIRFGCETTDDPSVLRFFVEDTGIGISEDNIKLVFRRFWKHEDQYSRSFRGVGIGLSLCEELVHLMGGTFDAESEPDVGSVFRFTIRYEQV